MRLRVVTLNVWNTEGDVRRPELINQEFKRLQVGADRQKGGMAESVKEASHD
jgi:hypothetical protein